MLGCIRPYKGRLTVGMFLMAIVGVGEGLVALMIMPVVNSVLDPSGAGSALSQVRITLFNRSFDLDVLFPSGLRQEWIIVAVSLLFIFLIKAVAEYLGNILIQYVGYAGVTDLRNRIYRKLIHQPIGFFQHHPVGRLMSVVISDVERVRSALSEWLADLFRASFSLVAFLVVMVGIDWRLTLASLVILPLVIVPVGRLGRRVRRGVEGSQTRLGELSQIIQETVSGNRVVKAFGMEEFETNKFRDAARRMLRENMRWLRAHVVTSPLMDVLGAGVIVVVLFYARTQITAGVMNAGMFMSFVYALFRSYEPIKRYGSIYSYFQQAIGASTQVFAFLDRQEEEMTRPGGQVLSAFSRSVVFENVRFAYDDGIPVLRNIDLGVRAGEVVALVGQSGAGKTTLVNLLPRFFDPTGGVIQVDGTDIRGVTLRSLREQLAIVTQENILFNDTVWNNICYGRPGMSEDRVHAAAQAALAHEFILELPQGYQTRIGDRGMRLSGGQRQRIAIARALLKNSPILILDEATSELDSESELLVQRALANLMEGRTVFVIAHRLSTIRRADQILVLEDGMIRERGTHQQLLACGGLYARLYELQFADAEPVARPAEPAQR